MEAEVMGHLVGQVGEVGRYPDQIHNAKTFVTVFAIFRVATWALSICRCCGLCLR